MQGIQLNPEYLDKLKKRQSKHKYYWQEQAEQVSRHFGKPLYWLFHRFPVDWIMAEYQYQMEKGGKSAELFIRILQAKQKKENDMRREELLEKMREDYRKRDLESLRRHFTMGSWLLTQEDKDKIQGAIYSLEKENLPPMVKEALKILGGRIVS